MESPYKLALVGAGLGAATGIAAALMMQGNGSSQTSTVNNIYIEESSGNQTQTAVGISATISGGKVL